MTTEPIPIHRPPFPTRARVRRDPVAHLERHGAEACDDAELLALLVGSGERATRTARRLIDRFGSLGTVAAAHPAELRLAGVAAATAARIAAVGELGRRTARERLDERWLIRTPSDAAEPLIDAMGALGREELRVLLLDTKNVGTGQRTVYRGNLAGSSVRVGEVFRDAVRSCAAAVVVVHNHPSGDPSPSGEDLRITAELVEAGHLLDIELLDHLVIGRGRWTSLRAVGAIGQPAASIR
jgi:DNA repair protein RadC